MIINDKRRVLGHLIISARIIGLLLIILAILDFPAMQFLTGPYAHFLGLLGSVVLLIVGVLWLFGISLLIRFFDQCLSGN